MKHTTDSSRLAEKHQAMNEAVGAYTRCEELTVEERRRLVKKAGVKMTLLKALRVTINFALGYIKNPWSFASIRRLAQAWLKLGERWFHRVYRWIKPCHRGRPVEKMPVIPAGALA